MDMDIFAALCFVLPRFVPAIHIIPWHELSSKFSQRNHISFERIPVLSYKSFFNSTVEIAVIPFIVIILPIDDINMQAFSENICVALLKSLLLAEAL